MQPNGSIADIGGVFPSTASPVELDVGQYWVRLFADEDDPDPSWTLRVEKGDTTPSGCPRACADDRNECVESGVDPFDCDDALLACLGACS